MGGTQFFYFVVIRKQLTYGFLDMYFAWKAFFSREKKKVAPRELYNTHEL